MLPCGSECREEETLAATPATAGFETIAGVAGRQRLLPRAPENRRSLPDNDYGRVEVHITLQAVGPSAARWYVSPYFGTSRAPHNDWIPLPPADLPRPSAVVARSGPAWRHLGGEQASLPLSVASRRGELRLCGDRFASALADQIGQQEGSTFLVGFHRSSVPTGTPCRTQGGTHGSPNVASGALTITSHTSSSARRGSKGP